MQKRALPIRVAALTLGLAAASAHAALTVTAPPAGSTSMQSGSDYATDTIGDAWDMNNAADIDTDESGNLTAQTFSGGVFSATASGCGAFTSNFYASFQGYGVQTVAIARGPLYPIDTAKYRYFTMKIKTSNAQQDRMLFLQNGDANTPPNFNGFGSTLFKSLSANQWTIQTWDLYTDTFGSPNQPWQGFPTVQGIRIDPCTAATSNIQIDWIRITAPPTVGQSYNVVWTDTGSATTYTITAIDADGARYQLNASGVSGTSYSADVSRLAPGDYHIEVKRADNTTATSAGVLHLNTPAQVAITAPTQRGEQTASYAVTEQGGQWGPMSPADFTPSPPPNFTMVSYSNPVGSFYGRPTNVDPNFIMKTTGHPIDTSYYRSACFTLEVFGPRDVGQGSIARLFWGVNASSVSTTTDIVLGSGLVEYCMPDLADAAAVPLIAGSPQPWSGNLGYFRMDPDEFTPPGGCNTAQTCHDVRLDSIILAPFADANPTYTIQWNLTDPDFAGGGTLHVMLDQDKIFGNGNEKMLTTQAYATGAHQFTFVPSNTTIADGKYYVVISATDGKNLITQYSRGPLLVHSDLIFRDGFE